MCWLIVCRVSHQSDIMLFHCVCSDRPTGITFYKLFHQDYNLQINWSLVCLVSDDVILSHDDIISVPLGISGQMGTFRITSVSGCSTFSNLSQVCGCRNLTVVELSGNSHKVEYLNATSRPARLCSMYERNLILEERKSPSC